MHIRIIKLRHFSSQMFDFKKNPPKQKAIFASSGGNQDQKPVPLRYVGGETNRSAGGGLREHACF